MLPNTLQQNVIKSHSRVTLIAAQAGSGSTAALLMKIYTDVKNSKEKLGIYYRLGSSSSEYALSVVGVKVFPGARFSSKSKILTTKDGVRIKAVEDFSSFSTGSYLPCVGIDHFGTTADLQSIFKVAGKIAIVMYAEEFNELLKDKESWPYKTGVVEDGSLGLGTSLVTGYIFENIANLGPDYLEKLYSCPQEVILRLTSVKIQFPVDNKKDNR